MRPRIKCIKSIKITSSRVVPREIGKVKNRKDSLNLPSELPVSISGGLIFKLKQEEQKMTDDVMNEAFLFIDPDLLNEKGLKLYNEWLKEKQQAYKLKKEKEEQE